MKKPLSANKSPTNNQQKIIFFDGVCHLCNSFVDFVIQQDREQQFQFAPLQGETAKKLLGSKVIEKLDSVIYLENGQVFDQSRAVLKIFSQLPAPYHVISNIGALLPLKAKDLIYQMVAKNRYRWFGEKETCRLPRPEEKSQFLE